MGTVCRRRRMMKRLIPELSWQLYCQSNNGLRRKLKLIPEMSDCSGFGVGEPRTESIAVQVQVRLARNQRKDLADLLEAVAKQEMRVPPVAFGAEDVEVRLRRFERGRAARGDCQAIAAGLLGEGGRDAHWALRRMALL